MLQGRVISEGSRNCYLRSEHRLVVGLGVENLVVVETDDAVLIADRAKAQEIKTVVKQLETDAVQKERPIARSTDLGGLTPGSRKAAAGR